MEYHYEILFKNLHLVKDLIPETGQIVEDVV
jgi:hypothetical protein